MGFGRCRQKAVNDRQRAAGVEPAQFIGNRAIDGQNAFAKGFIDGLSWTSHRRRVRRGE